MSRREHPKYFEGLEEGLKQGRREPNGLPKSLKEGTVYQMLSNKTSHDLGKHLALLAELDSNGNQIETGSIYEINLEDYEDVPPFLGITIAKKIISGNKKIVVLKKFIKFVE